MGNKKILLLLLILTAITLFLHLFKMNSVPSGFNADEAAYGYNAYSILKTGRDEYGNILPLRLVSFGDYKLVGYSYTLLPFIAIFGLSPWVVRLPALLSSLFLIWIVYILAKDLFKNRTVGLVSATLVALSPGVHILARHAHETIPATTLILFGMWCIVKLFQKTKKPLLYASVATLTLVGSMYFYHSARVYALAIYPVLLLVLYKIYTKKYVFISLGIFVLAFIPSLIADATMPPARLATLFIGNSEGVKLIQQQLMTEFARSPFSTSVFVLLWEILRRYVSYFSPDFLIFNGDVNPRFSIPSMSIVSFVEYVFILIGVYFVISKIKNNYVHLFILYVVLIAPLSAALSWQEASFSRSYLLVPLLLILSAYGIVMLYETVKSSKFALVSFGVVLALGCIFVIRTWEFYFFHYPLRPIVVRAWESGFEDLVKSIDIESYDKIFVGVKDGQPYIHFLFWLKIPPHDIQGRAMRGKPDEYGFTQVIRLNNLFFTSDIPQTIEPGKRTLLILSDDQAKTFESPQGIAAIEKNKITKNGETLYILYELTNK